MKLIDGNPVDKYYKSCLVILSIGYLVLAMQLPVTILSGAITDDALFFSHAYQITLGNWLGDYNQLTLAKGSGFPILLAINAILGTPITLFVAALYLLSCFILRLK